MASDSQLDTELQEVEEEFMNESRVEEDGESDFESDESDSDSFMNSVLQTSLHDGHVEDDVSEYLTQGCGCHKDMRKPCSAYFSGAEVTTYRYDIAELDKNELDMAVLAQLHAGMNSGDSLLTNTRGSTRPETRQRVTYTYMFKGRHVCREMFCFLHNISRTRLYNLTEHLITTGFKPRVHGNKGRKPKHACQYEDITRVVDFIKTYADVHAVPLPGRLPKHQDYRVMKLPSDVNKKSVYSAYHSGLEMVDRQIRIVSYRQFCRLWQNLVPFVTTMKPSSDLCMVCQENISAIMRSSNMPEENKSEKLKAAEEHLQRAKGEREKYNEKKNASKQAWKNLPSTYQQLGKSRGNVDCSMLYSFDHAQLVHIPCNPLQPGPTYFKTARKCEIFGICCEGSRIQTNYLIDEAESIGKGANSIISYVHHYLESHGVGEKNLQLQADNCVGQNKNNAMMQYLMWCCLTGKHSSCSIHFMIPGHTRFSPDQYFGLIKRKYRKTRVSSVAQLSKVVVDSTLTGANKVQLAYDSTSNYRVPCYDWKSFLSNLFKPIPSILKYQHFYFSSNNPGMVELRECADSEKITVDIRKPRMEIDLSHMPSLIIPPGIPLDRQTYLYEQIRVFCEPEYADITCPPPNISTLSEVSSEISAPPAKRVRLCSNCKQPGHTKTVRGKITCPKLLN